MPTNKKLKVKRLTDAQVREEVKTRRWYYEWFPKHKWQYDLEPDELNSTGEIGYFVRLYRMDGLLLREFEIDKHPIRVSERPTYETQFAREFLE